MQQLSKKRIRFLSLVSAIVILSALVPAVLVVSDAIAARCGHVLVESNKLPGGCDQTNWNDARAGGFEGNYQEFQNLVNKCQGTDSVTSDNWSKYLGSGYSTDTEAGNCSNAVKSCFQNAIDTSACQDGRVLALISSCNEGDVGSGRSDGGAQPYTTVTSPVLGNFGKAGCGTDNAIDVVNEMKGTDYQTNDGLHNKFNDDMIAKSCAYATSSAELKKCEDGVRYDSYECLRQQGALKEKGDNTYTIDKKFDNAQLNDCVIRTAKNKSDCEGRGGKWDEATKACTNPNPPDPEEEDEGPAAAPNVNGSSVNGKCGQARVNLLDCGEEEGEVAINNVLKIFISVLSVGIGIAAVGGLAWASILYAKAQDNEGNTKESKELIRNIVIGLFLYGFVVAIINWLVPGGVIGT